jgi:hypothetical protein
MKLKKYGKGGKYDMYGNGGGVNPKKKKMTPAEREAEITKMAGVAKERLEEMAGEKEYLAKPNPAVHNGGKTSNPDKKVRPEVGKWYMKQSKEIKSLFDNAFDSAYKRGASGAQARETAIRAVEKKIGKTIEFKGGGKMPSYKKGGKMIKYLKGGQVKLDANKDGKITGSDFMMLRKK